MKKQYFKLILASIFIFGLLLAPTAYAAVSGHTLDYDAVDSGEIRYGGSTKYTTELNNAISQWNSLDTVYIAPDNASTIEDVTISDTYKESETWSGLYTWYPILTDTIKYNTYIMDNRDSSVKSAQNKKTVMHEFGHALGIDDHDDSTYSAIVMYGYPNTTTSVTAHDEEDYNLAN